MILKFLIFNLKTLDGNRGSALKLIQKMKLQRMKNLSVCSIIGEYEKSQELNILR